MKKRLLGILLSFALMLTMIPGMGLTAYAADYETIEITNDVYDETSVSTLINSLDGFSKLSSEEAESWEPPTRSGNERLIYDYEGENNNICVAMFENGNFLGNATISLGMAQYPGIKYYYAKKTVVAVNSVTLNPSTAQTIDVDGKVSFTATVAPDNATDKKVKWSVGGTDTGAVKLYTDADCTTEVGTDATETLTVYAKGMSAGSATVTATSNADSEKKAECTVTVTKAAIPYLDWDETNKKLVEKTGDNACKNYTEVTSSTTNWGNSNDPSWYVVKDEVEIDSSVKWTGKVHLILCDGAKLKVNKGISANYSHSFSYYLYVHSQSTGDKRGSLEVCNEGGNGIYVSNGGVIVNGSKILANNCKQSGIYTGGVGVAVHDGIVEASNNNYNGIYSSGGAIEVYGGSVTANNNDNGIYSSFKVTVNTGKVTANNNTYDGISSSNSVTINDGSVTANENGTGVNGNDSVTINNGSVTANKNNLGISSSNSVTINDGSVGSSPELCVNCSSC